jgi:hypothetical protein
MTTNVQAVARALLDADDWLLTSELAATADMLDKPNHVSAIVANLRTRKFVESEKGVPGGLEQHHRVIEKSREAFRAWIDRDTVKPPSHNIEGKNRGTAKSAREHRTNFAFAPTSATTSGDKTAGSATVERMTPHAFYAALTSLLGLPPTWEKVCIITRPDNLPLIIADLTPPSLCAE